MSLFISNDLLITDLRKMPPGNAEPQLGQSKELD